MKVNKLGIPISYEFAEFGSCIEILNSISNIIFYDRFVNNNPFGIRLIVRFK